MQCRLWFCDRRGNVRTDQYQRNVNLGGNSDKEIMEIVLMFLIS